MSDLLQLGANGIRLYQSALKTVSNNIADIYGLSEIIGPGVANECVESKDGLHIWEDHFYPEVINPVTGEVVPEGEEGELVFTTLTKTGMPMIRYLRMVSISKGRIVLKSMSSQKIFSFANTSTAF